MVEHNVDWDQDMQASTHLTNFGAHWGIEIDGAGQAGEELVLSHFLFPLHQKPQPVVFEPTRDKEELVAPSLLLPRHRGRREEEFKFEIVLSHFFFPLYHEPQPVAIEPLLDKQRLVAPPLLKPR